MRRAKLLLPILTAAFIAAPVLAGAPAQAATFGPNLETATPNFQSCDEAFLGYYTSGCTVRDPIEDDMELVLPNPVEHGNQTGVVTAIHVKAAAEAIVQFIVVGWTGKPTEPGAIPTAVTAVSEKVTLHQGINNFHTNLPVERKLVENGWEDWSQISLSVLTGESPIPAEAGGSPYSTLGFMLNNGLPLTETVADLTVPPNSLNEGGLGAGTLLMSGEVEITTPPAPQPPGPQPQPPGPQPQPLATVLALPAVGRIRGNAVRLPLRCVGPANCIGTFRIQSFVPDGAILATHRKGKARKRKRITYASGSFSIPAGKTRSVTARLSRIGKRVARRHRSLRVYVNVALSGGQIKTWRIRLKH
jgi:hypothetical protein